MMIFIGLLVLLVHFYICKISTDFCYYLKMICNRIVRRDLVINMTVYRVVRTAYHTNILVVFLVGFSGANSALALLLPLAINSKFEFYPQNEISLLLICYSLLTIVLTNWLSGKKYPYKI